MRVSKKIQKLIIVIAAILMFAIMGAGCSKKDPIKDTFKEYKELWIKADYAGMYEMLSADSKQYIDKDTFVERYENIYGAIKAKDMKISINNEEERDKKSLEIPFTMKAKSIVGDLIIEDFNITFIEEDKIYKVKWDESMIFPQMIAGDKVRVEDNYSKRGSIFDKDGMTLAQDDFVKSVGIHPSKFENEKDAKIAAMASTLDISEDYIREKLAANTNPEHFVPIVDVLQTDFEKLDKLSTIEGVIVNNKRSRVYSGEEAFGNLIGHVGPITAEELEANKDKGYDATSLIGKAGLEKVYEESLRGEDGARIYLLRGELEEEITIAEKEAVSGQDIKLSIDSALQIQIYNEMNGEKGAATAVNPKTGEVLAMVSSPSYDSNIYVTYKTKAVKEKWEKLDGEQFDNRFNNVYSPGSTIKLVTAASGLNEGVITPAEEVAISGKEWQPDGSWGDYKITRVTDPGRAVNLRDAILFSDNIYFGQTALKLGEEKFINGAKNFGIGEELNFEFPMENSQISNSGDLKKEILLADSGYGQGELLVSPLDVALMYSALSNEGSIMKPRLDIGLNPNAEVWKTAIKPENVAPLIDGFTAVINDVNGTARDARIEGHSLAGKTGTAEIKEKQGEAGIENGWFVATDVDSSKISISMFIENVQGRGGSGIPTKMVKNVLTYYLNK